MCMLYVPDRRPAQCGFVGRECLTSTCIHLCTCMCVVFLTGDLPSAVWPAGFAACVCVLWLFPDRRPAVRSGRQGLLRVYVYCGSSLTGDLPSAVWPAGYAAFVHVLWLFPDRRPAECGLAGRVCCVCMCVVALP